MKNQRDRLIPLMALFLTLCLGLAACDRPELGGGTAASPTPTSSPTPGTATAQPNAETERQRRETETQARPDVEKRRKEAEQRAQSSLDKEAIAAIEETRKAVAAITANKREEALAAIERATGKINVLVARNPANALIPVSAEVEMIDAAPLDLQIIKARAKAAEDAVEDRKFPAARVLLTGLTSEIHARTYNLPLATYPAALTEAARLLDQQNAAAAATVLMTALNTLVAVDRVNPLPVVVAQRAIEDAQNLRDKDKPAAQRLLAVARLELERAKELGYMGKDEEYIALNKTISDLESQLKGTGDTASAFTKLKEKVQSFFKRQSESEHRS